MLKLLLDLRYSARQLWRTKGFSIAVVLVLTLGIGATVAVFQVIDSAILHPLPYPDANRVVVLWGADSSTPSNHAPISPPDVLDFAESGAFAAIAGIDLRQFSFALGGTNPEQIAAARVSPDIFSVLGIQPMIGHSFTKDEAAGTTAVISHDLWEQHFNSDPQVIGKTVSLDGVIYTIVGVMPSSFHFPVRYQNENVQVWMSEKLTTDASMRGFPLIFTLARLKPEISLSEAQQQIQAINSQLAKNFPDTHKDHITLVLPLASDFAGRSRTALLLLFSTVAVLLLIGCINITNLMVARSNARMQETSLRIALGANRASIIRQVLAECLIITALGILCGIAAAYGFARVLSVAMQAQQEGTGVSRILSAPALGGAGFNSTAMLFVAGVFAITIFLIGLVPVLESSRSYQAGALQSQSRSSGGVRSNRIRATLVVAQVGLSLVLVIGAGLMARTLFNLMHVDLGFRTDHLLTYQLTLPAAKYPSPSQRGRFYQSLIEGIAQQPGVQSVAAIGGLPLTNWVVVGPFIPEGIPISPRDKQLAHTRPVSETYFTALGIRVLRGQVFSPHSDTDQPRDIVINETLARRYWPTSDPIGQHVKLSPKPDSPSYTIIGVVADVHQTALDEDSGAEYYASYLESPARSMGVVVRTTVDPATMRSQVARAVQSIDPDQPIAHVASMDEIVRDSSSSQRTRMMLVGSVAGLALVFTVVGILGLVAYVVSQRIREIGIRMALGAGKKVIFANILFQGLRLALAGIVLGLMIALGFARLTSSLLYGVTPFDLVTYAGAAIIVLGSAVAASLLPAMRAAGMNPMDALRHE